MLIIISLCIIFILFIVCIMTITLSDTETFKAIDRKIANRIERKGKKKWNARFAKKKLIGISLLAIENLSCVLRVLKGYIKNMT